MQSRGGSTRCWLIRKLAQSTAKDQNERISIIKSLLSTNCTDKSISDEFKTLLSDKNTDRISLEIALIWELQAAMAQKLSQLALTATQEQNRVMADIHQLTDSLKRAAAKAASLVEDERKKLIVVQEVFRQNASEKAFRKSFHDKSFKLALEELLEEKSEVRTQRNRQGRQSGSDDVGEGDNTKYFSIAECKDEFERVRNSFISPADSSVLSTQRKRPRRPTQPAIAEMHPFVRKLMASNATFARYPVVDDRPTRDRLPVLRDPNVKIDIWALLKDNIGKDMSRITMPVHLNEPLTQMQRKAEILEYCELLRKANRCDDPLMRLILVFSCFYMQAANTAIRLKKPFNPLLGETYEFVSGDLKFVSEQVSHHPPICAFHCECDDFVISGDSNLRSNLSIASCQLEQLGTMDVMLKRTKETFPRTKYTTVSLHNYIFGKLYLWVTGQSAIFNSRTRDSICVDFKPKGWNQRDDFSASGVVTNAQGEVEYQVTGKWNSFISVIDSKTKQETQVVKRYDLPANSELQFNFSKFAVNANHLSTEMLAKVPPTDSRFRPDQRAYENGDLELAAVEKNRLEENQRKRRRALEAQKKQWKPLWFDFEMTGKTWKSSYKGGYFEALENGCWPSDMLDLFND